MARSSDSDHLHYPALHVMRTVGDECTDHVEWLEVIPCLCACVQAGAGHLVGSSPQRYHQMPGAPAGWAGKPMVVGGPSPHLMRQPMPAGGPMVPPGGTMHLVRTEQGAIRMMGGPLPPHRPPDHLGQQQHGGGEWWPCERPAALGGRGC